MNFLLRAIGVIVVHRTYPHSLAGFQTRIYQADKHVPCNPSNGILPGMYRYNDCCIQGMETCKRQWEDLRLPQQKQDN